MIKNKNLHLRCDEELYSKIAKYRDEKKYSNDSTTVRELVIFAFRILEHSDDNESLSTRELLEKILFYTVKDQYVSALAYHHLHKDEDKEEWKDKAKVEYSSIVNRAKDKFESILSGGDD